MMEKILGGLLIAAGAFALVVGISALLALPVMWLWNGLMPDIFGLKSLTFLQAWGLSLLSEILFKSHNTSSKKD
ncbi:MAG: hypothetical protein EBT92_14295 [Planctomycetes bacterium]|nr:hypothetical protein [Planctomycetota bacterium]